jgi:hypothetical protein
MSNGLHFIPQSPAASTSEELFPTKTGVLQNKDSITGMPNPS